MDLMNLIETLLGGGKKQRQRQELPGILGAFSKWIVGCSCLLVGAIVAAVIMLLAGIISFGQDAMTVIIVVATIVVALASLIRTSTGY
jgi:hypothetical protein